VYGELAIWSRKSTPRLGSSPRVRGTQQHRFSRRPALRFIPACTGNSGPVCQRSPPPSVHPRVYGELAKALEDRLFDRGSSPRVRGTRVSRSGRQPPRRFIPACTGNSSRLARKASPKTVHPRVYGELLFALPKRRGTPGSSPRVRGTQVEARLQWHPYRFIPACTGNSIPRGSLDMAAAVHPRVYGELPGPGGTGIPAGGSSPRVRGTPRLIPRRGRAWRFIPACTGNSVPSAVTSI